MFPDSIPERYQGIIIAVFLAIWLVGFVFQFLVIRKLKAIAKAGGSSPSIAREMLNPISTSRSFKFLKFLLSSEVSRLDDPVLKRDCQILRVSLIGVVVLLVAGVILLL